MKKIVSIFFLIAITFSKVYSQYGTGVLDLGFENGIKNWIVIDQSQKALFTKDEKCVEGNYSLSIEPNGSPMIFLGVMANLYDQKGRVEIVCSFRGNNINDKDLDPHLQTMSGNVYMGIPEISNEVDGWRECRVTIDLKENVNQCMISLIYKGKEKILVDNMKLRINGVDLLKYKAGLYSKISDKQVECLYQTAKIWGFLKYHHPAVMSGKYNWDQELFAILNRLKNREVTSERNEIFLHWVKNLGDVKNGEVINFNDTVTYSLTPNYNWIIDSNFPEELVAILNRIKFCERENKNFYLDANGPAYKSSKNEKITENLDYSDLNNRLLYLFRFWNNIEYFSAYKNLTDKNWDDVLKEYIPKFARAKTKQDVHSLMAQLTTETNDTHCFVKGEGHLYFTGIKKKYCVPVNVANVENKVIVVSYVKPYLDSIPNNNRLNAGDEVIAIDDVTVEKLIEKRLRFCAMSNYNSGMTLLYKFLTSDNENINLKIIRDGKKLDLTIKGFENINFYPSGDFKYKMLNDSIFYMVAQECQMQDLYGIFGTMSNSKAAIFDLRGYPNGIWYTLARFIMPKPEVFALFSKTTLNQPGLFKKEPSEKIGVDNPHYYKGKIILLVNENSISHSEATIMAWQVAPNVLTIGSQTAGTDGNVSAFVMPDGVDIYISSVGVYYPNGEATQRVGIRIDEVIKPTIKGIREGRDELLEKAIEKLK